MKIGHLKLKVVVLILSLLVELGLVHYINQRYQRSILPIPKFEHDAKTSTVSFTSTRLSPNQDKLNLKFQLQPVHGNLGEEGNPKSILLPVPFTPQAPTANWDQLHNEACEEASALMANAYFSGNKDSTLLSPELVEQQITALTKWQDDQLGYHLDITSQETAQMIEQNYVLHTKLIPNFTETDIKKELAQNHLVLISENGQLLSNPYYKQPGPIHHMLLLKGYNSAGFITNDPGTKRGLNYFYDFSTLYSAAADWNHASNTIDISKKIAIVVWK